jgi:4-amino-4-deoxy-L-arabinose transferase-like glycosyltransferase
MKATEITLAPPQATSRPGGKNAPAWRHHLLVLSLIVFASFAVRVAALRFWGTGAIESEGAEYARIAENLRKGFGYVGIATPGPELNLSPLFPFLISGVSLMTGNYEQGGRLVCLVLGALLPLPMFGIASRLFNRRVGFAAAILTMLHPLLVNLSFTVLSEGPYATLLLSAVYVVLRALNRPSIRRWLLVGGAFGLAYLVRPEAVAPLLIAAVFALTATQGTLAMRCKRAAGAVAVFAALALPWVISIYRSTGKVRLDGKSAIVFALGARVLAAQANLAPNHGVPDGRHDEPSSEPNVESWQPWEEKWASNAINANLERSGVWMRPNADVIREPITVREIARIVEKAARQNMPILLGQLSARWLGAPFLPALALLGALRRPWRRPLASSRLFVMLVPATTVAATFSVLWIYPRFYFALVPFLLLWAANGLVEVGRWTKASSAAVGCSRLRPTVSEYVIPGLIGLAVIIYPLKGIRALYEFTGGSPSSDLAKEVGLWIGEQQNRSVRIMDLSTPLAFHAGAQFVYFPYCSGDLALRFLGAAQVDYVVLRREEKFTRYYEDWLTRGIPDPKAQLVYASSGTNPGEFVVYRWSRPDGPRPGGIRGEAGPERRPIGSRATDGGSAPR